jgi:predicted O-methyltransferase YrrM
MGQQKHHRIVKQWFYDRMAERHRHRGLQHLRALESDNPSRENRFSVPFLYRGSGHFKKIEPRQNLAEIEGLYKAVCDLEPRRILEIGTARGGTLYLWAQAATDDAIIVSVDLPGGEFGGAYPACRVPFYESFARENQTLHLVRRDSHEDKTVQEVQALFQSDTVDFVFIDGDHTYEGVKSDFALYSPLVRPGGVIAFHDILPRQDLPEIQVDRFWREIRGRYESAEFIGEEGSRRRRGIGLIRLAEA